MSKAATVQIDGKEYSITEDLGYQNGYRAKFVQTQDGEQVAVKRGGKWTFWTWQDRIGTPQPAPAAPEEEESHEDEA